MGLHQTAKGHEYGHSGARQTARSGARLLRIAPRTLLALLILLQPPAATAQDKQPIPVTDLLTALLDPQAEPAARDATVAKLLSMADGPEVLARLGQIIAGNADVPRRSVLSAIVRLGHVRPEFAEPISKVLELSPDDEKPLLLSALGSTRSRVAVRVLLDHTQPQNSQPIQHAAFDSLARLTGRYDLPRQHDTWVQWFEAIEWLPEGQWQELLIKNHAAHARELEQRRAAVMNRLLETYRRLVVATSIEARHPLLAALLLDDVKVLRNLGFELVARELAVPRPVGQAVAAAAVSLLGSPDAKARTSAAQLVNRLAPPDAGPAVNDALSRETDKQAAEALLLAARRWPSPVARGAILDWLEKSESLRPAAIEAVAALHQAGLLEDDSIKTRVLTVLRETDLAKLNGTGFLLVTSLGDDWDRAKVAQALGHPEPTVRRNAAEALAGRAEFLDRLLDAAEKYPELFALSVTAAVEHRPTAAGYRRVTHLASTNKDELQSGLLRVAAQLNAADLVSVAQQINDDPAFRAQLLARLGDLSAAPLTDSADAGAIAAGLVLLAQTRIELDRPDAALAAIEALPAAGLADPVRVRAVRIVALLMLNRLDDANELESDAPTWLDGLARSMNRAHAPDLAAAIAQKFAGKLTEEQSTQLATLLAKLTPPSKEDQPSKDEPGDG